jgi:hypothetical protein
VQSGDTWVDDALAGVDRERAARYRDAGSFLDRTLEGISDDTKIHVLRVMVNTHLDPTDVTNVLYVLLGYITEAGEKIPRMIGEVTVKLDDTIERAVSELEMFPEVVSQVAHKVADEIAAEAMTVARAATRSAGLEELDLVRQRIALVAEDGLTRWAENALTEKRLIASDFLIQRSRAIFAVAALVVFIGGWLGGASWGTFHPHLSSDQLTQIQYGREFIQMYPHLPDEMHNWVVQWVKTHPTE